MRIASSDFFAQMFTDFVAECRADKMKRMIAETEALEEGPLEFTQSESDTIGMQTVESPRPVAVAA